MNTIVENSPVLAFFIFLGVLAISIIWIAFPFLVSNGFSRLQKLLTRQNELLDKITERQNETNKALQWIVDNWSSRS
ncbi:MAG: hypothetical protein DME54_08955 [Verrucomicrobia bacterium]|nr:MAG: hypothetical protein DMF09_13170 [Verrucomicrobiota bacterium]PYJ93876.1 MAG: hypothetical protein DME62_07555 [Verrucomicrobiota bacterium]PYK34163.1 MAG: hypothetical protein DME54_08955 [Verrucomicrobiota bacterium]PYL20158.1 MAG: hypothetical protein DMF41_07295 [Verrucomicrobiota bacterium]PYL80162.1 MAG: hypothetical protein DMF21_09960 [Verrucomicrobiota bacterium]